jgi:hypothetical protein
MRRLNICNLSKLLFVVVVLVLFVLSSCNMNCIQGEGPVVTADKHVDNFSQLEVSVPAEVTISIGDQYYVGIEAQQNVIEAVSAKVKGETLVLKASPCVSTDEIFRISITVPGLSEISINGSGSVMTKDMLVSDELEVNINGSGDARINLTAEEVEADINGSGDIILSGSANEVDIEINGSGDVRGLDLSSNNVRVEINGSGDVEIDVSEKLTVDIAGSGNVSYTGNPRVKSSVNGSGEVSDIN